MGVRPPRDDDDEPETIAFGIAAVDARLEEADLTFPASRSEVAAELGDAKIPYDAHGNAVTLRKTLESVDAESFDSSQDLLNALHPVFERRRKRASTSVVKQMRSLLPF